MQNFKKLQFILFTALFVAQILTVQAQSRQDINFNTDWSFKKTKDTADHNQNWEKVTLPHTWNATDMQLSKNFYEGEGIYKKEIVFGNEYQNKRLFLRFEGVGQVAQVYVNDKLVGVHKGSYSAFCVDITYAVVLGKANKIVVKANNTARKDIIPVNHFLFGIYGGIYRPVSLIVTNQINITTTDYASPGIYISQKNVSHAMADLSVLVKIENRSPQAEDIQIKSSVFDQKGKLVLEKTTKEHVTTQGRQKFTQDFSLVNPTLWDGFNNPYLYKVVTQVIKDSQVIDEVSQPLGIRKFEIVAGKGMLLNNKPYKMYGVARHQDRWQFGNALSNAQHKEDLDIIKEMGTTTIRFAHYQQAEYLYSQCDSMGFVIWAEIPFVNTSTGEEGENAKQQMTELIKQNYNHPSIYVWGLHNEVYGKTIADYPAALTRDLDDIAKTLDPYRYTASVSGYGEMTRPTNLNADIQGMNRYYGWYEGKIGDLENWASGLESKYPNNKVMLTEYGADGNVFQQQEQTELKDTFDYGSPFYPETYETKTHEIQWPIIAKHPYITASYIWNMFDFATPMWNRGSMPARNMKGLVTFDRKLKKDAFYWYKVNWSTNPVLYLTERRAVERKHANTQIVVYSNIGVPEVYINGKKLPAANADGVLYRFENVTLKKGKNIIKTKAVKNGKVYTDEMIWSLK
ncbi:glycoside hydrolase family 2 protein [Pedobacter punctiformis]|uniref:Beta-galactosidase n=1 Tax=Pedobacter punctiformis TaxID=3004097 RepID=A0ABT4L8C6_9SPHI|nr:glycoside hydrolase family 2 TIM barrel-domain containing protein [Pedobacter sp. HCMS5-2]MCZ4244076.1 beta-galactosidase [Pedobacter sp. HCMS5-2]